MKSGVGRLVSTAELDIARPSSHRSAFVVGPRWVLTADHCLTATVSSGDGVWLRLRLDHAMADVDHLHVPVVAIHRDRALDVAMLEIDEERLPHPIEDWAEVINLLTEWAIPLDVGVRANQTVRVEGYPAHSRNPDGRSMSGRITDPRARVAGVRALELFLDELAASAAEKPEGLSGAPVLATSDLGGDLEVAVGVVRAYSKAEDGVSAVGGGLYATAIDDLISRFPELAGAVIDTDVILLPVVRSAILKKFLARKPLEDVPEGASLKDRLARFTKRPGIGVQFSAEHVGRSLKNYGANALLSYSLMSSFVVQDQTFTALRVLRLADRDPRMAVLLFAGVPKLYERPWAKVLRKCAQEQPTTTAAIVAALSRDYPDKAERMAGLAGLVLPQVMP